MLSHSRVVESPDEPSLDTTQRPSNVNDPLHRLRELLAMVGVRRKELREAENEFSREADLLTQGVADLRKQRALMGSE
jgi:hypothetical protein